MEVKWVIERGVHRTGEDGKGGIRARVERPGTQSDRRLWWREDGHFDNRGLQRGGEVAVEGREN